VMGSGRPAVLEVRLTGQDVAASEMICGGNVDVLIEPLSPEDAGAVSVLQTLAKMTAQGRRGVLVTVLSEGRRSVLWSIVTETGRVIGDAPERFEAAGVDPQRWAGTRRFALEATAHGLMARLLGWFERAGRARAIDAIRRLETTRVVEAGQLRRYAQQWAQQDPRMTADLMAAADRHEQGY